MSDYGKTVKFTSKDLIKATGSDFIAEVNEFFGKGKQKMTNEELIKEIDKISNQLKRITKQLDYIKECRSMLPINDSPAAILYDATINEVDEWIRSLSDDTKDISNKAKGKPCKERKKTIKISLLDNSHIRFIGKADK